MNTERPSTRTPSNEPTKACKSAGLRSALFSTASITTGVFLNFGISLPFRFSTSSGFLNLVVDVVGHAALVGFVPCDIKCFLPCISSLLGERGGKVLGNDGDNALHVYEALHSQFR